MQTIPVGKIVKIMGSGADWTTDSVEDYMRKVRYNLVERLRTNIARE